MGNCYVNSIWLRYNYEFSWLAMSIYRCFSYYAYHDKMRGEDNGFETKWARKSGLSLLAR